MIFAELPLSMSIRWMLNSSTLSVITNRSSWGCLIPKISGSSFFGIFIRGSCEWTLFIFLPCAFFKDFSILPTISSLEIFFISPAGGLLSLTSRVLSWSSFHCYLWGSIFLTYFCNFPYRIKISTWSFKCLHSLVQCP